MYAGPAMRNLIIVALGIAAGCAGMTCDQNKKESIVRMNAGVDFAKAKGWRSGENPALWRGHLKSILPARQRLTRGHHAAMPYRDVPAFLQRLRGHEAMSARALEFLILTAARSGEVLGATWLEFDLEARLWTVPATRMKAGTAQKMVLNMISTAAMIRLGYVKGNRMTNVKSSNVKLKERSVRILMAETGLDETVAQNLLNEAAYDLRVAIVMQKAAVSRETAEKALAESNFVIEKAVESTRN
jgi:integrase